MFFVLPHTRLLEESPQTKQLSWEATSHDDSNKEFDLCPAPLASSTSGFLREHGAAYDNNLDCCHKRFQEKDVLDSRNVGHHSDDTRTYHLELARCKETTQSCEPECISPYVLGAIVHIRCACLEKKSTTNILPDAERESKTVQFQKEEYPLSPPYSCVPPLIRELRAIALSECSTPHLVKAIVFLHKSVCLICATLSAASTAREHFYLLTTRVNNQHI